MPNVRKKKKQYRIRKDDKMKEPVFHLKVTKIITKVVRKKKNRIAKMIKSKRLACCKTQPPKSLA